MNYKMETCAVDEYVSLCITWGHLIQKLMSAVQSTNVAVGNNLESKFENGKNNLYTESFVKKIIKDV